MTDISALRLWMLRAGFAALCLLILFWNLLPLQTMPRGWVGPDVVLLLAFAWSVRRPEYVPAPLLALVFLLADFLLQRPPGLWAALALIAASDLKARARTLRDFGFGAEWLRVGVLIVLIAVVYHFTLALLIIDTHPLGLSALQAFVTLLCYPVVTALGAVLFGVRKVAPGDLDGLGQRV